MDKICAGSKAKVCAKYAKNMRNPKNGSGWPTHITSPRHFCDKIWWYFWSGRSADHFKYPQGTFLFFSKILVFWGVPKMFIWTEKMQNMRKICANMRNPEKTEICAKYAQICGNMSSTYIPPLNKLTIDVFWNYLTILVLSFFWYPFWSLLGLKITIFYGSYLPEQPGCKL